MNRTLIGKRVRLLVHGLRGRHRGKYGKIVSATCYRNIFNVRVGAYIGPYHRDQLRVI